ncbi:MAG: hypothetical protein ACRCYQ_01845, partial [Nocardioides sp.]
MGWLFGARTFWVLLAGVIGIGVTAWQMLRKVSVEKVRERTVATGTAARGASAASAAGLVADTPKPAAAAPEVASTGAEDPVVAEAAVETDVEAGVEVAGGATEEPALKASEALDEPAAETAAFAATEPEAPALPEPGPYGEGSATPLDGGATPHESFTIKGNQDSMLYHPPESPYYGR